MALQSYERVIFNFGGVTPRKAKLENRAHTVVPMVMMTEGVHAGNRGPLYYPGSEFEKTVKLWNHRPFILQHPGNTSQSAADPEVLDTQKAGLVLNARYTRPVKKAPGKLQAEAWIENERADELDERLLQRIMAGEVVSVSTGLGAEIELTEGEFDNKFYTGIVRNHVPDHLAVLLDERPADTAAGLLVNATGYGANPALDRAVARALSDEVRLGDTSFQGISFTDIRNTLNSQLQQLHEGETCWVEEIHNGHFVYWLAGKLWNSKYMVSGKEVDVIGDPSEVVRVTEYRTPTGTFVGNAAGDQEPETKELLVNKKEMVTHLITNAGWEESDRTMLEALPEPKLKSLVEKATPAKVEEPVAVVNKKEPPVVKPEPPAVDGYKPPATMDDYINNHVPPELRDGMRDMYDTHQATKKGFIETILTNKDGGFTAEYLATLPMGTLQGMARMVKPQRAPANFSGAQGGYADLLNSNRVDAPSAGLDLPSMDSAFKG